MSRARSRDSGAAAVEFALLLPVFLMLTFGMISAGFAFWHNIALTQGARDAARLGSTYPIGTGTGALPMSDWLDTVAGVAAKGAGWDWTDPLTNNVASVDNGYICVAYIAGNGDTLTSSLKSYGVTAGASLPGDGRCFDDGTRSDSRVQVVVQRNADFNLIIFNTTLRLSTQSVMPYERLQS